MSEDVEIQAMVDRETAAWDARDAEALVALFHPDMVWPWPPDAGSHDSGHLGVPAGSLRSRPLESGVGGPVQHATTSSTTGGARSGSSCPDEGDGGFAVVRRGHALARTGRSGATSTGRGARARVTRRLAVAVAAHLPHGAAGVGLDACWSLSTERSAERLLDLIAFDGDDTLWHNERGYRIGPRAVPRGAGQGRRARPGRGDRGAGQPDRAAQPEYDGYGVSELRPVAHRGLHRADRRPDLRGRHPASCRDWRKEMLTAEVELFDGARGGGDDAGRGLPADAHHQGRSASPDGRRSSESGLGPHFRAIEVVSHQRRRTTYRSILARHAIHPSAS